MKSKVYLDWYPLVNQHSNGKSPFWIGNISSKGPFSIAILDYRKGRTFERPKRTVSSTFGRPQARSPSWHSILSSWVSSPLEWPSWWSRLFGTTFFLGSFWEDNGGRHFRTKTGGCWNQGSKKVGCPFWVQMAFWKHIFSMKYVWSKVVFETLHEKNGYRCVYFSNGFKV